MRGVALLLVASAGCKPTLDNGRYACGVDDPTACPPGWYCQIRELHEPRCYDRDGPHCNDGVVDPFERCDGEVACTDVGFYGVGMAPCSADCTALDSSACRAGGFCGDGKKNGPEECDGLDQGGASCFPADHLTGGALGCSTGCARTFDTCIEPWEEVAVPALGALTGVWFSAAGEGFAVGVARTILHYTDSQWIPEVAPARESSYSLIEIAGTGPDDVYAVGRVGDSESALWGDTGVILRREGGVWRHLILPPAPDPTGWIPDLWASEDRLYLAAGRGLFRWNLADPSASPQALYSTAEPDALVGVRGRDVDDVYAVGGKPDSLIGGSEGKIIHWNGHDAQVVYVDPTSLLTGLWVAADVGGPIYAVGKSGLVQSTDGRDWRAVPLQPPPRFGVTYGGRIWGRSASDLFVIFGQNFPPDPIQHFDGTSWVATTPGGLPGGRIWDIGGTEQEVFAVGEKLGASAMWRYTRPPRWARMSSPYPSDLRAITGTSGGDLFAVGAAGTVLRFDGNSWAPWTSLTQKDLSAAWSPDPDRVLVAGDETLLRCAAGTCTPETFHSDASGLGTFTSIWGNSAENVFAMAIDSPVGGNSLWQLAGGQWIETDHFVVRFRGLWGDAHDVLAVGTYVVERQVGSMAAMILEDGTWRSRDPGGDLGELTAVWGTSMSHVFSVATDGRILHYDGATWLEMARPQAQSLNGIWGRSADDVYAVGDGGSIQHYDGASWSPMFSGTTADLNGVWGDGARGIYAVGDGGVILHLADVLPATPGGDCPRPVPLYCGAEHPYFGDTIGGEARYRFDSPITGRIEVRLDAHARDLELLVVGADGDRGCARETRLAAGAATPVADARVEIAVVKDQTVYVVVDGAASGYTLTLDCTPE